MRRILVHSGCKSRANGFVEAETAAVKHDLVNVGAIQTSQQSFEALILVDDSHAVEDTSV